MKTPTDGRDSRVKMRAFRQDEVSAPYMSLSVAVSRTLTPQRPDYGRVQMRTIARANCGQNRPTLRPMIAIHPAKARSALDTIARVRTELTGAATRVSDVMSRLQRQQARADTQPARVK